MTEKPQNINMNFGDGKVSKIDEDVKHFIITLQNEIKSAKQNLPFFGICHLRLRATKTIYWNFIVIYLNTRIFQHRNCFKIYLLALFIMISLMELS